MSYDCDRDVLKSTSRDLTSIKSTAQRKTERGLAKRTCAAFTDVKDVIDLAEKLITSLEKFKVSEVYAIYIGVLSYHFSDKYCTEYGSQS